MRWYLWFDPNNSLFEFHFYNRDSTCWSHKSELASTGYGYGKWRPWSFIAKEFDNFCTLEEHYITYHDNETPEEIHVPPNNTHKCETCSKTFSLAQSLKTNIYVVHEGHKDHKCKSCGKSFSQPGNLKKHIHKIHEGRKDHKCVFCGKSFSLGQSLKRHIYTIHKGHKYHKCVSCGKSFSSARYLKHWRSASK